MKEAYLMEKSILKTIGGPVDFDAAAITGARVDMRKFKRVSFIVILGAGTTTAAHLFTLKQHTVASAGTPADLSVDNPYFHKIGAATEFTKVSPSSAAAAYDLHSLLSNSASIVVFEVLQEQLTDGYRWVSLDSADVGGVQIGAILAIGHEPTELPAYGKAV